MHLIDEIEAVIRAWPQWSRAEQAKMKEIIAEIMSHVRDGGGNAFVKRWCDANLGDLSTLEKK